ncbi:bpX6 domain-containing protein [Atopomonas hussainii]|uniref:bpX6 domain-containing protein n=1 Tax=Atopomonas hussainii TaxID=1429083 RepID=UPI00090048DE|nr:bpX6 domain-containing protein [Atopomonas hussainii]
MLEYDGALIRRPVLTGHQQIEGLWFSSERFDECERAHLILDQWQTGASVYRFAEGDLLRFCQPVSTQCEALVGWPLIRQSRALCSAPLAPQEVRSLPAADVWLVRGSHVSALQLRDAAPLVPGQWIDVSGYTLLDTYDCRGTLPEPVLEPLLVPIDVREILGGGLGPVSPEREGVMQALLERQRNAPQNLSPQTSTPANNDWTNTEEPSNPWLKLVVSFVLVAALFWIGGHDNKQDLYRSSPNPVTPVWFEIGGLLVGALFSALLFTLLLMGVRKLLGRAAVPGRAPQSPVQPQLAPRATPVQHKPAAWRRWLTRLTLHSRLSALYGRRQAAYMRRMLEMFENGDLEEALRHAIPLDSGQSVSEQEFGTPQRRQDLAINQHTGPSRSMMFEEDLESHLRQIYRHTFERLDREGRIEEAVFVLAELLKVRQESLDYLEKHGRYQQAADLALAWDMPAAVIVRLLCLADNWQRALLVARRDDAFADAVVMLQERWPESADRLRLEWAESLTGKGLWLQAVDVIWSLPSERGRAAQWLLNAEEAGGRLAIGALVKRAILLPDTLVTYGAWVEQLRDDPLRFTERAALAETLLLHKNQTRALAWLTRATVHAIIADQASGHGRLTQSQVQTLVKMSKDKLLQADLPVKALARPVDLSLRSVGSTLELTAPLMGSRAILDAVPLDDSRYLLALGEAGAVVIDAAGKTLFHFPVPAQTIVLAHSRQMALVLALRDDVWRISKLDLVNRTATDLGVQMLDVFAKSFDGAAWTIGRSHQLRVVDVDRGFETLWHVSDLPGRIVSMHDDLHGEFLWLANPKQGSQLWHYRLPDRRLLRREPIPARTQEDSYQLFSASSEITEFRIRSEGQDDPILVLEQRGSRKEYRLPGCVGGFTDDGPVRLFMFEHWLLIGYVIAGQDTRWHFIHSSSDRLCTTLQWPLHDVQVRCLGADWLLFDHQGRLTHINADDASQRNLSLN